MTTLAFAMFMLGFAVGLFCFKVKSRWCKCGRVLACPDCAVTWVTPTRYH